MVLAPTPCLETGCPDLATHRGRCAQHQVAGWTGARKARLPKDWRTRRLIVLRRDNGICHWCGEPGADEVDHVNPGDDHSLTNLRPIHSARHPARCHAHKSSAEGVAARRANRVTRRR